MALTAHPDYDPALPAKEAASYVARHYKTLIRDAKRGRLPYIESEGGRLYFRLSDLNGYLDSRTRAPRSTKAEEPDWGA